MDLDPRWTSDSKLIVSWLVGGRDGEYAIAAHGATSRPAGEPSPTDHGRP